MEGVGARLGRSSTRYGPTTVFTGPVRKWKKNWVHVSSSSSQNHHNSNNNNGNNNGASHLLLFKWSPVSNRNNNANANANAATGDTNLTKDDNSSQQPPPKKFKYIPIAVLEEQKKEDEEDAEEEATPSETDLPVGATIKGDGTDGKPDINDVPMEEAPATAAPNKDQSVSQDLNETSLDLSLGLKGHDEDHDSDAKPENQAKEGE